MYEILHREDLAPKIVLFKVKAPEIAEKARPGQFIILRQDEKSERIPLTIADYDKNEGSITIIFQEVGKSTELLGQMNQGDFILDVVGPLGLPSEVEKYGTVVCVGGGVGIAPIYPITRALYEAGNRVISIIGARSGDMLILRDEMEKVSSELHIATDDGSLGTKGFVTDVLAKVLEREKVDKVWAIGPAVMMKAVSATVPPDIPVIVSLNPIMVDGTGMCGACRVEVAGKTRFACVDGPEFEGHEVNWDLVLTRAKMFVEEEKMAMEAGKDGCRCQKEKRN